MLIGFAAVCASPAFAVKPFPNELYVGGFLLGPQAYTFNRFSLFEAIDNAKAAGCSVIEMYPGQRLSPDSDVSFDHNSPVSLIAKLKMKLESAGVRAVNYGVVRIPNNEEEARKIFDFAKVMGLLTITTEPEDGAMDLIEKLVKEYDIRIAIHNHPKTDDPNYKFWDPKYVLSLVKDRDPRIGSCSDLGHWARSGIKPVEALRMLEGRVISCHMKDLNEFGVRDAHDVVWGKGVCDVAACLDELRRQHFSGNISIEYEYNWDNSLPEVKQCVDFVREYGKTH
ncbi:MAG: TIM barrel protein [bacterium]|nr:TIM barrel protein [bacterium]